MTGLFITATGTDVGKTAVTALLIRQLMASGRMPDALKPVLSGFDDDAPSLSDASVLLAALERKTTIEALDRISPWRFTAPLSPDMAAAREGRTIAFDVLVDYCRTCAAEAKGPLLVEGVGGAMVPLDSCHTVLDWMAALGFPALLVSGTYLGAISHTLTTLAAIEAREVEITAIVLSTSVESPVPPEETRDTLARFTNVPIVIVPRLAIGPDGVPDPSGTPDLGSLAR